MRVANGVVRGAVRRARGRVPLAFVHDLDLAVALGPHDRHAALGRAARRLVRAAAPARLAPARRGRIGSGRFLALEDRPLTLDDWHADLGSAARRHVHAAASALAARRVCGLGGHDRGGDGGAEDEEDGAHWISRRLRALSCYFGAHHESTRPVAGKSQFWGRFSWRGRARGGIPCPCFPSLGQKEGKRRGKGSLFQIVPLKTAPTDASSPVSWPHGWCLWRAELASRLRGHALLELAQLA